MKSKSARRNMITRSNLAEQLREYQIRSKHEFASFSFFSSASNPSSRMDVVWEILIVALFVFSAISLYMQYMRLALALVCAAAILFVCLKVAKRVRQNRKSKRRMLLPLSM